MKSVYLLLVAILLSTTSFAVIGPIIGTTSICSAGGCVALSDTTAGGVWTVSAPGVATISGTGILCGVTAGVVTVTYTVGGSNVTLTVTSNPMPAAITGITAVCIGSTTTLYDATTGGTWSSGMPVVATVTTATGIVTGVAPGVAPITYTVGGCTATTNVTFNPIPGSIFGPSSVCTGSTITLTNSATGGTWASSNSTIASISAGGIVTGNVAGSATMSYTLGTCGTSTTNITVNPGPGPAPMAGPTSVCMYDSVIETDATPGGVWASGTPAIATITSTGVLTGVSPGYTNIYYTIGSCSAIQVVTVNASPAPITGGSSVCVGGSITISDITPGGTWSITGGATLSMFGVLTGTGVGTSTITYVISTGCYTTSTISVISSVPPITGSTVVCVGATDALSDASPGGTWTSSNPAVATVNPTTGLVTGNSMGISPITYTLPGGCFTTTTVTVNNVPTGLTATATPNPVCIGGSVTFSATSTGSTSFSWSGPSGYTSSLLSPTISPVIYADSGTYIFMAVNSCGTATTSVHLLVGTVPTLSATFVPGVCNDGNDSIIAPDVSTYTYSWSPTLFGMCAACWASAVTPTVTTVYTLTITDAASGCTNSTTVTADANRISGFIGFTSTLPTVTDTKVWLIQFNPMDSSLLGIDSVVTCLYGGTTPYYEFIDKPAGSYMVKAKLISSIPGTSDYIPTYSLSSPHWDSAITFNHLATNIDTNRIDLLYGTVPPGPGFISGYIVMGAGKGTSGEIAAPNILVYLEDAVTHHILTYTYTNTLGAYSFSGLGYGSYIIYPTDYKYVTTPSSVLTLSSTSDSANLVDFKKHTTLGTITPFVIVTGINPQAVKTGINIYPNPTTGNLNVDFENQLFSNSTIVITDMIGREVYKIITSNINNQINISYLNEGIYFISVKTEGNNYLGKLQVMR